MAWLNKKETVFVAEWVAWNIWVVQLRPWIALQDQHLVFDALKDRQPMQLYETGVM
jgi:hypothetical protein